MIEFNTVVDKNELFDYYIFSLVVASISTVVIVIDLTRRYIMSNTLYDLEGPKGETLQTPEITSSIFSLLTFSWLTPLIQKGRRRPLTMEDLWQLRSCDTTEYSLDNYYKVSKVKGRSLLYRLVLSAIIPFTIQYTCCAGTAILSFTMPFFMNRILAWLDSTDRNIAIGWALLLAMFICNVSKAVIDGQNYFHSRRVGIQMGNILQSEIYNKAMRRPAGVAAPKSSGAPVVDEAEGDKKQDAEKKEAEKKDEEKEDATLGKIVTLMSVDTERFLDFMCYSHELMVNLPLSFTLAFIGLFQVLGVSALAGVLSIVAIAPISTFLGSWVNKVQDQLMVSTDKRVNTTNEVLSGIRIIKYFGWEDRFTAKILESRETELWNYLKISLIWTGTNLCAFSSSIICFFVTFFTYTVIAGNQLDAATAFTAVLLLSRFTDLLSFAPQWILWALKSKVSLDRINDFLNEQDMDQFIERREREEKKRADAAVAAEIVVLQQSASVNILKDHLPAVGFKTAKFRYYAQGDSKKETGENKTKGKKSGENEANVDGDLVSGPEFHLKNVDIEFTLGGLNVVSGSTGCGKSSLILALLGELKRLSGQTFIPDTIDESGNGGTVAYVAQTAWLLNASIRENILFGTPYDEERYRRTLHACALVRDLETFPGGDLTEIGEKGISLSGGQKQRISLARAVYSFANVVLLDDPLSAVDAPTARHLMRNAILTEMKTRTVVLVTHAVSLAVRFADHVVVLKNGEILAQGTPNEIAANPLVEDITMATVTNSESLDDDTAAAASNSEKANAVDPTKKDIVAKDGDGTKLVQDEEKATGDVKWDVYLVYLKACGVFFIFVTLFFMINENVTNFVSDWWLAQWTNSAKNSTPNSANVTVPMTMMINSASVRSMSHSAFEPTGIFTYSTFSRQISSSLFQTLAAASSSVSNVLTVASDNDSLPDQPVNDATKDTMYYITIYGFIGLCKVLNFAIYEIISTLASLKASRTLHQKLVSSVLGAPLRFFEVTPLGRILNRFSKDIGSIDEAVSQYLTNFLHSVFRLTTIIVVISFFSPTFIVAFIPIAIVYRNMTQIYLLSSRELKRLQSVSRSPIFSLFSETLNGVTTIRAYGQTQRFMNLNYEKLNTYRRTFYLLWASNRWLNFRADVVSATVIFIVGATLVGSNISAGFAGIILLYSSQFSESLLWAVRRHADMEMSMNSVERCQEYFLIEQEPARIVEDYRPESNWPQKGEVVVKDISVRYAPDQPLVLNKINFTTRPGEKIGVVGRTGAGKSTLSLAFFRIIPWAEGSITIDDMEIGKMGLHDLRQ
ncbi:hypothetical protein HDU76_005897, partial [Blyttiomyces sp. JEL0837]